MAMMKFDADTIGVMLVLIYVMVMFYALFIFGWGAFFGMLMIFIMASFVFVMSEAEI